MTNSEQRYYIRTLLVFNFFIGYYLNLDIYIHLNSSAFSTRCLNNSIHLLPEQSIFPHSELLIISHTCVVNIQPCVVDTEPIVQLHFLHTQSQQDTFFIYATFLDFPLFGVSNLKSSAYQILFLTQ